MKKAIRDWLICIVFCFGLAIIPYMLGANVTIGNVLAQSGSVLALYTLSKIYEIEKE